MGHLGAAAVFEILSDNGYSCVSPVDWCNIYFWLLIVCFILFSEQ